MATVMGDVLGESPSRFHSMIAGPAIQHQHPHDIHFQARPVPVSRTTTGCDRDAQQSHHSRPTASPRRQASSSTPRRDWQDSPVPTPVVADKPAKQQRQTPSSRPPMSSGGASRRLPSPPSSSSSSSDPSSGGAGPQYDVSTERVHDAASGPPSVAGSTTSSLSTAATVVPGSKAMPSPASDHGRHRNPSADVDIVDAPPVSIPLSNNAPSPPIETQKTIYVQDLAHIQTLAKVENLNATGSGNLNDPPLQQMKYEISAMPIGDIIEMVAALLTKITTTNDLQHDALNRNAHHLRQAQAQARGEEAGGDANGSPLSSSVLAFHGKNVPSISILSYLGRIHKYCPTTYEVFLSLLVYFDRMTERVNDMVVKSEEARRMQYVHAQAMKPAADPDTVMRDSNEAEEDSDETDSDLADTDEETGKGITIESNSFNTHSAAGQATYFVVDSYNIHRLIIAGVTCASKFFSDVFYTNSRYAKVGGLPLAELNHLELQFLLLNDFRLAVPVEDLEAYATMLVEFYAREVVSQKPDAE
ncbi:cyclin-like protein interacting with PHO85 [Podospora pseudocomata]|uniref:Cyclin-like protein interacting with PHO85 n=1 Tax=Podospora pseudocomata TaxID=2093779 RepID=A0ABR0GBF6_9PEZI|nr:cyclin-like protein interacting with PHO85 [Podospora pseudocomata]